MSMSCTLLLLRNSQKSLKSQIKLFTTLSPVSHFDNSPHTLLAIIAGKFSLKIKSDMAASALRDTGSTSAYA